MESTKNYFLITDVGSTTTKAILVSNQSESPKIVSICHADTTVEAPYNDVRFGVVKAIRKLQDKSGITLLESSLEDKQLAFAEGVRYLTTSSAGGGLQILVIGLTLFDSASSAKRAAYGAGGVILDVFSIDDKRKASEQMLAMRNLHPDMILLCGGTDGGALSGVLRLAEILRIAKPIPKFATEVRIPTIFAGNSDAAPMVKKMISADFDLCILPNLRPQMDVENLKPTQDMIQKLFMENVMERAPGYAELKKKVSSDIIPTPMGVLKSLVTATKDDKRNFFAFDIGGATTDVFSYINNHFQRTVSANLGMSYSALNVLAESGLEAFIDQLSPDFSETDIRNYIGNKTLYPTYNPQNIKELRIEHVLAKQAIGKALLQHQEMHFNTNKMGYLDTIKKGERDAYEDKFEYQHQEQKYYFYPSEIDVLIGAGGVFAHAANHNQCIMMLIDSFDAHGFTELWLDKDFITPHLGVLSDTAPELSKSLLNSACMERLALHIRPYYPVKAKKDVMEIVYEDSGKQVKQSIAPDTFLTIPAQKGRKLRITPLNKCLMGHSCEPQDIETDLMVIIDTRISTAIFRADVEQILGLYNANEYIPDSDNRQENDTEPVNASFSKVVSLPYKGEITRMQGDKVTPDDVVAINQYNPPRLYIVSAFGDIKNVSEQLIRESLTVQAGEIVEYDSLLRRIAPQHKIPHVFPDFRSPVRGKIEFIDFKSGIIVLSEIQDYSKTPVHVNLAEKLSLPPKKAMRYLCKKLGDFVYQGDLLAQRLEAGTGAPPAFVRVPSTGQITAVDAKTAIVTIQYKIQAQEYLADVNGVVEAVENDTAIVISYKCVKLEGKLGIGKRVHGNLLYANSPAELAGMPMQDKIVCANFAADTKLLNLLISNGARGLVCPGIDQKDLIAYYGAELGVINTGNEKLPLCLIITEAFGVSRFSDSFSAAFSRQEGAMCYLEPHTRIRAGVARPFICFSK